MSKLAQVYLLLDPRCGIQQGYVGIIYGRNQTVENRISQHLKSKKKVGQWLRDLANLKINPTIAILETLPKSEAFNREVYWMQIVESVWNILLFNVKRTPWPSNASWNIFHQKRKDNPELDQNWREQIAVGGSYGGKKYQQQLREELTPQELHEEFVRRGKKGAQTLKQKRKENPELDKRLKKSQRQGGLTSVKLGHCSTGGKKGGKKAAELKVGIHAPNFDHAKGPRKQQEQKIGIFAPDFRHKYWHVRRNIVNLNCSFCLEENNES